MVEDEDRVLAFEAPGRVVRVAVHRGDWVKAGQPVAELDDSIERLAVEARRHEEAAARAELGLLTAGTRAQDVDAAAADVRAALASESYQRKVVERARRLAKSGSTDQADVDRAEADLERATAQRSSLEAHLAALRKGARREELARAQAQADQATSERALEEERLARYTLRAAEAGEVLDVHVKAGELAAVGTPAVTLADTNHPYADVFVPEGGLAGIHIGTKARVRVDASPESFAASVEYVSPETEFTPKFLFSERERPNLVIRVRVRLDDPDRRLHSGVPAFAVLDP
ncbi:MAG: HlyD family secretion protein [Myxococcales bacterium]